MGTPQIDLDLTYVALIRISTNNKIQILSPEFQEKALNRFSEKTRGTIIETFYEEESGESRYREELNRAITLCQDTGSALIVYKLARASRLGLEAILMFEKAEIEYFEVLAPNDSLHTKEIKLVTARQDNRERKENIQASIDLIQEKLGNLEEGEYYISKAGNKITKLGNPGHLTDEGRKKSIATRKDRARKTPNNKRALAMVEVLLMLPTEQSFRKMANYLNTKGFPTARAKEFTPIGVSNLLTLYGKNMEVKQRPKNNLNNKHAYAILKLLLPKKLTLNEMSNYLNTEGFETSGGKQFTPKEILKLLTLYGKGRQAEELQKAEKI